PCLGKTCCGGSNSPFSPLPTPCCLGSDGTVQPDWNNCTLQCSQKADAETDSEHYPARPPSGLDVQRRLLVGAAFPEPDADSESLPDPPSGPVERTCSNAVAIKAEVIAGCRGHRPRLCPRFHRADASPLIAEHSFGRRKCRTAEHLRFR